jgi:hypothetical protein
VKPSVYGFSQRPFVSIPGMLFEQVMQVRGVWRKSTVGFVRCTS